MKKGGILVICMILLVSSTYSAEDPNNLGEVITVSVDHVEPMSISSDYLKARDFPVTVFLRGFTLGSLLFGEDSPDIAPFFGGIGIKSFTVQLKEGHEFARINNPIFPRGNKIRVNSKGEVDLGYLIVNLRKMEREEDIPEEIELDVTAKFRFDGVSKFGLFGQQDLFLYPEEEGSFLRDPTSGAFWSNRGYVRILDIDKNSAKIELYDGSLQTISNFELKEGKEYQTHLRGAPSLFANQMRVKLKDVLTPQTNAKLIVEKEGEVVRTTVVKGMKPFIGSSWVVKEITFDSIIFESEEGDKVELSGSKSVVLEDPCENIPHLDEDFLIEELETATKTQLVCSGIVDYKLSLDYAENVKDRDEAYLRIAEAYEELGAHKIRLEYYEKISEEYLADKPYVLDKIISLRDKIDIPSVFIDDVTIFLSDIEEIHEETYFTAIIEGEEPQQQISGEDELQNLIALESESRNIPIDILLAIAEQESNFKHCKDGSFECGENDITKSSSGAIGVMQIVSWEDCGYTENEILDVNNNIDCGAKLLKQKYNSYKNGVTSSQEYSIGDFKQLVNNCISSYSKYGEYKEWDAAIRAYNGWGCESGADVDYVEKVNSKKSKYEDFETIAISSGEKRYVIGDTLVKDVEGPGGRDYDWKVKSISKEKVVVKTSPSNIEEDKELTVGINYVGDTKIKVQRINFEKAAIISILPGSGLAYGSSDFTISLPVEKRLIQWTPEEIDKKIEKTASTIEKMDKVLDSMGKLIKGWKTTCIATYSALVLKNLKTIQPRKAAIKHYTEVCAGELSEETDRYEGKDIQEKVNNCLKHKELEKEDIGDYIEKYDKGIQNQKRFFKTFDKKKFGNNESVEYIKNSLLNRTEKELLDSQLKTNEFTGDVSAEDISELLLLKETDLEAYAIKKQSLFDVSKKDDYELIANKINELDKNDTKFKEKVSEIISSVFEEEEKSTASDYEGDDFRIEFLKENVLPAGKEAIRKDKVLEENEEHYVYAGGEKIKVESIDYEEGSPLTVKGDTFYNDTNGTIYAVRTVEVGEYNKEFSENPSISLKDNKLWIFSYPYARSGIFKYSDHANYVITHFDQFGEVEGFSIVNVGSDGLIDYNVYETLNDDLVVLNKNEFEDFYPLRHEELERYYKRLDQKALEKDYKGGSTVNLDGNKFVMKTFQNAVDKALAGGSCQSYMSAKDCQILFNVCDPVMCPASRFDLGGKWQVSDVISTGIIGSVMLGIPNSVALGGDMWVPPICLTGVHAGLDNIRTGYLGYQDCLQKAKTGGEYVGVCNEITGIYACEMLWREALALTDAVGKISDLVVGAISNRFDGGDAYAPTNFKDAFNNLGDSVDYFANEYATSSFSAFNQRSSEEFGSQICKAAIRGKVPTGGDFLSQITDPTSPPQFTAWVDELEYTNVEGGKSVYRVYYHIYSGRDRDVRYNVYLKNSLGEIQSALDSNVVFAGARFLKAGEYVDKSFTLVAKPGFDELCVDLDGVPHCNFGKVTSAFSVNYLNDELVKSEAQRDINGTSDCVPEYPRTTPNLGSIPTSSEVGLLQTGVIRRCSNTGDPDGSGEKWVKVGTCGEDEYGLWQGDCYLDRDSLNLHGEDSKDVVSNYLNSEILEAINLIKKNEEDANKLIQEIIEKYDLQVSQDEVDELEVKLGILELRDVIEFSESNGPKYDAYYVIGDTYVFYPVEEKVDIDNVTITDEDGTIITDEEDPDTLCEIEYEEDSKNRIVNIMFKFIGNEWKWKEKYDKNYKDIDNRTGNFLEDIYSRLISDLRDGGRKSSFSNGLKRIIEYSNYDPRSGEDHEGNDDYIIVKKKDLKGDDEHIHISYEDVLTSCDGEDRPMNCIMEYEEDGFDINWLFRFNAEKNLWTIKTSETLLAEGDGVRLEHFYKFREITQKKCNFLSEMDEAITDLCEGLISINEESIDRSLKFEKGIREMILVLKGPAYEDELFVYYLGEKKYSGDYKNIEINEIYEACKYESETEEEEESVEEESNEDFEETSSGDSDDFEIGNETQQDISLEYCTNFDCTALAQDVQFRFDGDGSNKWERRLEQAFGFWTNWEILNDENYYSFWYADSVNEASGSLKNMNREEGISYLEDNWETCLSSC